MRLAVKSCQFMPGAMKPCPYHFAGVQPRFSGDSTMRSCVTEPRATPSMWVPTYTSCT